MLMKSWISAVMLYSITNLSVNYVDTNLLTQAARTPTLLIIFTTDSDSKFIEPYWTKYQNFTVDNIYKNIYFII